MLIFFIANDPASCFAHPPTFNCCNFTSFSVACAHCIGYLFFQATCSSSTFVGLSKSMMKQVRGQACLGLDVILGLGREAALSLPPFPPWCHPVLLSGQQRVVHSRRPLVLLPSTSAPETPPWQSRQSHPSTLTSDEVR